MRTLLVAVSITGVFGLAGVMLDGPALADKDDKDGEEQISLNDLPAPIKQALKNLKVGDLSEIEREGGVYEVELRVGKHEVGLELDKNGRLLAVEIEQADDDDDDNGDGDDDD